MHLKREYLIGLLAIAVLAIIALLAFAFRSPELVSRQLKDPKAANVSVEGNILEPEQLKPTPELLDELGLPEGFEIAVFAEGLQNPRMLASAPNGRVYATRRSIGDVILLTDADGDGRADGEPKVVAEKPGMHGIAIDESTMYLVTVKELYRAQIRPDGTLGTLVPILTNLPDAGQHPNRTIAVGPDGALYLSVGSTCNACAEDNAENATILRMAKDGSSRRIFASGLRNTIGFGFEPSSGRLYGADHGIDWLGDEEQREELNLIEDGKMYGWPFVYEDGKLNPQDYPEWESIESWAARSVSPVLTYTAHAAPMQMAFYTGTAFPEEYRDDAFVAMRGSWNRRPPSGYEIARIVFEDGAPVRIEPFVTGFLRKDNGEWGHLGRLAGMAQASDGSLLLSDDTNGVIYRISYTGGQDR